MNSSIVIQFDSIAAIAHIICVVVQIGILIYANQQCRSNQQQQNYRGQ